MSNFVFIHPKHGICVRPVNGEQIYKGLPFDHIIERLDMVKVILRSGLVLFAHNPIPFILFSKSILIERVNETIGRIIREYKPKDEHYMQLPREIAKVLPKNNIAEAIKMFIQYDNAYRERFHDVIIHTTQKDLIKHPRREVLRLLDIMKDREPSEVVRKKIKAIRRVASLLLLVPGYRKRLIRGVQKLSWENIIPDTIDLYWMNKRADYKINGLTYDERRK